MLSFHLLPTQFLALLWQLKRGALLSSSSTTYTAFLQQLQRPMSFSRRRFGSTIPNPYQIRSTIIRHWTQTRVIPCLYDSICMQKITYHPQPAMKTSRPPNLGHAMGHVMPCQDQLPRPRPEDLAKIRHPTNSDAGAWARPLPERGGQLPWPGHGTP